MKSGVVDHKTSFSLSQIDNTALSTLIYQELHLSFTNTITTDYLTWCHYHTYQQSYYHIYSTSPSHHLGWAAIVVNHPRCAEGPTNHVIAQDAQS